jgi:hypothetical protein
MNSPPPYHTQSEVMSFSQVTVELHQYFLQLIDLFLSKIVFYESERKPSCHMIYPQ